MRDTALYVAVLVVAAALAYLGWELAQHRHTREPRPEPVSPATLARARDLLLLMVRRVHAHGPAPATDPGDDERDTPPAELEETEGASDEWADILHEMTGELAAHPGFTTDEPEEPTFVQLDPEDLKYLAWTEETRSRLYLAEERFARNIERVLERLAPDATVTASWGRAELDALLLEGANA